MILDRETVGKHSTKDDAWIIYNSSVYDITKFLDVHPGGMEILAPYLGKDVTDLMTDPSVHQHSKNAFKILEQFKIGELSSENQNHKRQQKNREDEVCYFKYILKHKLSRMFYMQ